MLTQYSDFRASTYSRGQKGVPCTASQGMIATANSKQAPVAVARGSENCGSEPGKRTLLPVMRRKRRRAARQQGKVSQAGERRNGIGVRGPQRCKI